jgi:hypothetical protein
MCTVLLPLGVNPIAVNKCIYINYFCKVCIIYIIFYLKIWNAGMRNFFADFEVFQPFLGVRDFKCIFMTVLWKLGWLVTLNNNSNNNRSSCSSENNNNTTWSTTAFINWVPRTCDRVMWLCTQVFYSTHRMCPTKVIIMFVASGSLSAALCAVLSCTLN